MMQYRALHFLMLSTFLFAVPVLGDDETLSCADKSIVASAVRTQEDVQAFVQCAYEFVQEVGFEGGPAGLQRGRSLEKRSNLCLRRRNNRRHRHGSSVHLPSRHGKGGGALGRRDGRLGQRLLRRGVPVDQPLRRGLDLLLFNNPATGQDEPKASYIKGIDWEGNPAAIGAGLYRRDLPGTCQREEVNAVQLEEHPSSQRLQEFVIAPPMELETTGYFGLVSLSTDPRWRSHSIYLFGVDMYGNTLFTGSNPYNWGMGISPSELTTIAVRDDVAVAEAFGEETFLYYTSVNPSNGMPQRKASFVKRVVTFGVPILIGAGYYLD